jgi:2-haloalkanoic acid dehalogenase type II
VPQFDVVLFDLLSALLDSWSLWNSVAGSETEGRRWRAEYLRITYRTGRYRPYEELVAEAAVAAGLSRDLALTLDARYAELQPWPEAEAVLQTLARSGLRLGVVTNCSERLGRLAVERVGVPFDVVVTAERAGWYKPDPHPYRLAIDALGVPVAHCLFVAGSAFDLVGTAQVGLPTYWHNRLGLALPAEASPLLAHERSLEPLLTLVLQKTAP